LNELGGDEHHGGDGTDCRAWGVDRAAPATGRPAPRHPTHRKDTTVAWPAPGPGGGHRSRPHTHGPNRRHKVLQPPTGQAAVRRRNRGQPARPGRLGGGFLRMIITQLSHEAPFRGARSPRPRLSSSSTESISGQAGLHLDGILTNGDFCLGLVYTRLYLLIGLLLGLVAELLRSANRLCRASTCSQMLICCSPIPMSVLHRPLAVRAVPAWRSSLPGFWVASPRCTPHAVPCSALGTGGCAR
jgi:hypothetical protein